MATSHTAAAILRPLAARQHHAWTALQLVHAVILKQHGGIGNIKIARLLNAHFSTNMSLKCVEHKLNLEAGTLARGEAKKRTDQGQLSSSALWNKVKEYGETSLEVEFVLLTHKLLTESEWTQRSTNHHELQEGLELDTESMMERLALLAVPGWTRKRAIGPRRSHKSKVQGE
ncbi:hypothetical protein MMC18_000708 [Xylographa bjoerkii]|nr:hypothetical protein [Xylographa bjoerkii]